MTGRCRCDPRFTLISQAIIMVICQCGQRFPSTTLDGQVRIACPVCRCPVETDDFALAEIAEPDVIEADLVPSAPNAPTDLQRASGLWRDGNQLVVSTRQNRFPARSQSIIRSIQVRTHATRRSRCH